MTGESEARPRQVRRLLLIIGLVAVFVFVLGAGMWVGSGGLTAFLEPTPDVTYIIPTGAPESEPGHVGSPSPSASLTSDPGSTSRPGATSRPAATPASTPTPAGTPVHWYTASPSPTPSPTPAATPTLVLPNLYPGYINLIDPHCGHLMTVNFLINNNGPVAVPVGTRIHFHAVDWYLGAGHLVESTAANEPDDGLLPWHGIGVNISVPIALGAPCGIEHILYVQVNPPPATITEGNYTDNQTHRTFTPTMP